MSKTMRADVVIIGAGIGGLLCAGLLGRDGYRVVIMEKLTFPGGRYTTLDNKGYKINTGAWAVGLHGTNGPLWQLISDLGAKVEYRVPGPHHARLWLGGKDIPLPAKGQLRTIIEMVSRDRKEAARVLDAVRRALAWQEPSDSMSCRDWLYQYTDNALIHGQFDFFSRAMTATYYKDFPAGEYFRLMRGFGERGSVTAMPRNGQKTTIDALLKIFRQWDIQLLTDTRAERIVCTGGKVEGLTASTAEGDPLNIEATVILSDAGPKETVRLAEKENFDQGYLNDVDNLNETMAVVTVFGYEKPVLGFESHVQFIETDRLGTAWEPCHIWPDYAPPGKHCLYTYSTIKSDRTRDELDAVVTQCQSSIPGLEEAEIIASLVFQGDWPILRARPSRCLPVRTPVQGLYLAGDAVNVSGWTCGEGISFSCLAIQEDVRRRFPRP